MPISSNYSKMLRFFKFSGKIITSLSCYFSIENSLFKIIFGHNFCICQLIFKIFVAHFTTNLDLNIVKKIFCLPLNKLFSGPHFRLPRFDYRIATVTTDRCHPLPVMDDYTIESFIR